MTKLLRRRYGRHVPSVRVLIASLLTVVITAPAAAVAALVPASGERIVNEVTAGAQRDPAVAPTESGGFLVVWSDRQPGSLAAHIRGRVLAADGSPAAPEFQVDGDDDYLNLEPDIARLADGRFIVVWIRRASSPNSTPILVGRKMDAAGIAVGQAFQLNPPVQLAPEDYLGAPVVAATGDGGFLAAWSLGEEVANGFDRKATISEVYVRRFDAATQPTGDPVMVSDPTTNPYAVDIRESFPRIRSRGNGFSVAWSTRNSYSSQYWYSRFTRLRHLTIEGMPTGTVIDVGPGGGAAPDVATTSAGDARVVWSPEETEFWPRPPIKVVGRHVDAVGTTVSPTYRFAETGIEVEDIEARAIGEDHVAVVWSSGRSGWVAAAGASFDGDGLGVFGGAFELDGREFGPPLRINETTVGDQTDPTIAIAGNRLLAVWGSITTADEGDVMARMIDIVPPKCGDNDEDGRTSASDALWSLQAAVGARACLPCGCDVNGSGDHSATDALAVLSASVGLAVDLACPACPGAPLASFRLSTDSDCSSAYATIPSAALPNTVWSPACEIHPELLALPCSTKITPKDEGLIFEARGCEISDREIFSCFVSPDAARMMAEAVDVGCGCRCRDECPSPRICTGQDAATGCSTAATIAARPSVAATPSSSTTPAPARSAAAATSTTASTVIDVEPTYTTSTFCGTCCGLYDTGTLLLTSDHTVTELIVRVPGNAGPDCLWCDRGSGDPVGDGTVEFCITEPFGLDGPGTLSQCQTNQGDVLPGPGVVIRALGLDFKPIDPPPNVEVRFE